MLYGSSWFGVTEANYSVVAVHLFSVTFGSTAWHVHPLRWAAGPLARLLPAGGRGCGQGALAGGGPAVQAEWLLRRAGGAVRGARVGFY